MANSFSALKNKMSSAAQQRIIEKTNELLKELVLYEIREPSLKQNKRMFLEQKGVRI